MLSIVD